GYFAEPERKQLGRESLIRGVTKSGSLLPLEVSLTPVIHHDEILALVTVVDVTERKAYEEELQFRRDEMEQLLYTVSHDLKSPLVTIQGFAHTVKRQLEQGGVTEGRDHLERIDRAAKRMNSLIHDLLELSRAGRREEEYTTIKTADVVADAIDSHAL